MNTHLGLRHSPQHAAGQPVAPLSGFEPISRHWEAQHGCYVAKLLPGEYYVTEHNEAIFTVLGSCISACIRDPVWGIGGMNHFMLPIGSQDSTAHWQKGGVGAEARYGNYAMELLINGILKHGGSRHHLEVKIFGGGRILAQMTDVGKRNIAFIHAYVCTEGLRLVAEDVGDRYPRKLVYFPASGRVKMKKLRALHTETVVQQETRYLGRLSQPAAGEIELF